MTPALTTLIANLRAASNGSSSLDAQVRTFLVIASNSVQPTRNLSHLLALRTGSKTFDAPPASLADATTGLAQLERGEWITTFGTGPTFPDHSHGSHPSNALLSAVIAFCKHKELEP